MKNKIKFLIIGDGALGLTITGRFIINNIPCLLMGRKNALKKGKYLCISTEEKSHLLSLPLVDSLHDLSGESLIIIVCVKSYDLPLVAKILLGYKFNSFPIVLTQNGFNPERYFNSSFKRIIPSVMHLSSTMEYPRIVRNTIANRVYLDISNSAVDEFVYNEIEKSFLKAKIDVQLAKDIVKERILKLIISSTGSLMCLRNISIEKSIYKLQYRNEIIKVIEESSNVFLNSEYCKENISYKDSIISLQNRIKERGFEIKNLNRFDNRSFPSIWQDLNLKKGKTEVEEINGFIWKLARRNNYYSPINEKLTMLIRKAAKMRLSPSEIKRNKGLQDEVNLAFAN